MTSTGEVNLNAPWRTKLDLHRLALLAVWLVGVLCPPLAAQNVTTFEKHLLNAQSEFGAATSFDVNLDGLPDIVCGAWWYAAPHWTAHHFREIEKIRGRYDDYSNLALDVDNDGDQDIVSVNYRSRSLYWCRNPGPQSADQRWDSAIVDRPGTSETGRLVDIDNDGHLDILPNGTSYSAWYQWQTGLPPGQHFVRRELPRELIGHGIGAGDVNGDGRIDIVSPHGWAQAPEDRVQGRWLWHPEFRLADDCGLPILCYDVDRDGDADLVWGRGHNVGLYWTEQVAQDQTSITFVDSAARGQAQAIPQLLPRIAQTKWITHAIDTTLAGLHTLILADLDGDGHDELVNGKRYLAHEGQDPGENDPLSVQWHRFDTATQTWQTELISYGGTCGIDLDTACVDLDGDGDIDIIAPTRVGLHWLENLRIADDATNRAEEAQRELAVACQAPLNPLHGSFESLIQNGQTRPLVDALHHGVRRQQILRQMEQVMGVLPSSAMRAGLDVQVESVEAMDRYWRIKLTYAAETAGTSLGTPHTSAMTIDRVPAYLLVPDVPDSSLPAMLCLHQTDFEHGKGSVCGLGGRATLHYAHELAREGYVCLAPDYPGFVDYEYDFAGDRARFASGTMKAIWNNIRAIDLLETLPCVDNDRIGAIGHSLGGHNALFTAAFDQRVRCVITSCGFNAFADYYRGDLKGWSSDRYMPRIATEYGASVQRMPFDFPEVLAAIAPRPLFVNAPLHDDNFAVAGVRKCEAALRPLLEMLGKSSSTRFVYPDEQHDFPDAVRAEAYAWLKENL